MADMIERPFVSSPATARNTDKTIIGTFDRFNDFVRFPEQGEYVRVRHGSSVAVISNAINIWSPGIEGVGHVLSGELLEGSGLHSDEVQCFVDLRDVRHANAFEDVIGK